MILILAIVWWKILLLTTEVIVDRKTRIRRDASVHLMSPEQQIGRLLGMFTARRPC